MATKQFLIEEVHSKWGRVKLEARVNVYPSESGYSWCFYHPDGSLMGEWDTERGGGLGHPNFDVDQFMKEYMPHQFLYDLDSQAYEELEYIIDSNIRKNDPTFFLPELEPLTKW